MGITHPRCDATRVTAGPSLDATKSERPKPRSTRRNAMRLPSGDQPACHAFTAIVEATARLRRGRRARFRDAQEIAGGRRQPRAVWRPLDAAVHSNTPPTVRSTPNGSGASTCRVPSRPKRTTLPLSSTESSCGSADCSGAAPTRAGFDRRQLRSRATSTDERVQPERSSNAARTPATLRRRLRRARRRASSISASGSSGRTSSSPGGRGGSEMLTFALSSQ